MAALQRVNPFADLVQFVLRPPLQDRGRFYGVPLKRRPGRNVKRIRFRWRGAKVCYDGFGRRDTAFRKWPAIWMKHDLPFLKNHMFFQIDQFKGGFGLFVRVGFLAGNQAESHIQQTVVVMMRLGLLTAKVLMGMISRCGKPVVEAVPGSRHQEVQCGAEVDQDQ